MTRPDDDRTLGDRRSQLASDERDLEAPTTDAAEQAVSANPADEPTEVNRWAEVGEWDAVEQSIVVDLDDDYDH